MSYSISTGREPLEPRETKEPAFPLIEGWDDAWSDWVAVMNPTQLSVNWEIRDGDGYRLKPRRVSELFGANGGRTCGIYEFMAMKGQGKVFVVYVGSSCRSKGQSLPARINEYCANGSHKADLINDALVKGYTLYFRYKFARNKREAENDENSLLVYYSYAWNKRTITGTLPA